MRVRYRQLALEDIDAIYKWIAAHGIVTAAGVEASIFEAITLLGRFPGFGSMTDEPDTYRWPMGDYRYTIFYRIAWEDDVIEVLRVVDSRRVRNLKHIPR